MAFKQTWQCEKCSGTGEYADHHGNSVVCNMCEGKGEMEQIVEAKTSAAPKGTYTDPQ